MTTDAIHGCLPNHIDGMTDYLPNNHGNYYRNRNTGMMNDCTLKLCKKKDNNMSCEKANISHLSHC
jgi:hypothetical protein